MPWEISPLANYSGYLSIFLSHVYLLLVLYIFFLQESDYKYTLRIFFSSPNVAVNIALFCAFFPH